MKATQQTTYRMLNTRLSDVSLQLEKLRSMGASGKKLAVASDDPASVRPVLNTRKQLSNVDRHLTTLGRAADTMAAADTQLGQVENIMQRAKEIMTGAGNGTLSPADRTVLADELAQLRDQLIEGILGDMARIAEGAPLPALGEGSVCEWCAVRGLCRKDFWNA